MTTGNIAKPKPQTGQPAKDILVLGGRALEGAAAQAKADYCACDFVSVMGARPFSDYRAVVYWPDDTALELPPTYEAWQSIRQRHPNWSGIPAAFWTVREQVRAREEPNVTPSEFPQYNLESPDPGDRADLLLRAVRSGCFPRLREMTKSALNGQGIICVLPTAAMRPDNYTWITPVIDIIPEKHSLVVPQKFPPDFSVQPSLKHMCKEAARHILAWPYSFSTHLVSTWNEPFHAKFPWRELFPAQPNFFAAYPDIIYGDYADEDVRILAPHMTNDGQAKSVLLLMKDGFVLFIPEPTSIEILVQLLRRSWLAKTAMPSTRCSTCRWRHRPDDFTELIHPKTGERLRLNAETQAPIIERLHDSLEENDGWVDFNNKINKLEIGNYKTPGDAFRGKRGHAFDLLVEVELKRCRLKSPKN
jgi:hypothetical protein